MFPKALRAFISKLCPSGKQDGCVSAFQALCTALAATVGTGNIAGVAGAIAIGGPGSVFWMWVCAVIGMATKFSEATLAVRFCVKDSTGNVIGGPMYMIRDGMGRKWAPLAWIYSFLGITAAFGVGNATQINAVISGINSVVVSFGAEETPACNIFMGIVLACIISAMLLGGARRIGTVAEKLVPVAASAYLIMGSGVLVCCADKVPMALRSIFLGAFCPEAVTGGVLGSVFQSLRVGVSRGVFTNEAGMGTASIAHASAKVSHPVEQGLMGIMEVFLDTIVICTVTALVILCTDTWIPYGTDEGVVLTTRAFASVYGDWVSIPISFFLCCFAFATVLGWGLYGMRCAQYIFGASAWKPFVALQAVVIVCSSMLGTGIIWTISETVNGMMAIPNLIALAALSPELVRLTKEYKLQTGDMIANGGTYENVNQCKPLRTVSYAEVSSPGSGGTEER